MSNIIHEILSELNINYSELNESCPEVIEEVEAIHTNNLVNIVARYSIFRTGAMPTRYKDILRRLYEDKELAEKELFKLYLKEYEKV